MSETTGNTVNRKYLDEVLLSICAGDEELIALGRKFNAELTTDEPRFPLERFEYLMKSAAMAVSTEKMRGSDGQLLDLTMTEEDFEIQRALNKLPWPNHQLHEFVRLLSEKR